LLPNGTDGDGRATERSRPSLFSVAADFPPFGLFHRLVDKRARSMYIITNRMVII